MQKMANRNLRPNRNDYPIPQIWDLGVSMNTAASKLVMLETSQKRNPVLSRKDLSMILKKYVRNCDRSADSPPPDNRRNYAKRDLSATTGKRPKSTIKFHDKFTNVTEGIKSIIKNKVLMQLRDNIRRNMAIEGHKGLNWKDSTRLPMERNPKAFFYKTQLRMKPADLGKSDRNGKRNNKDSIESTLSNTQILMPLVSRIQATERIRGDYKSYSRPPQRSDHSNTNKICKSFIKHNRFQYDCKLPEVPSFINNTSNTDNMYNFIVDFKCKADKGSVVESPSKKSVSTTPKMSKVRQKLTLAKNIFSLSSSGKTVATTPKRLKTPRCCHQTKRVIYLPRVNTEHMPLVVINFEGVLGDVYQKTWWSSNEIGFYVKPRTL